MKKPRLLCIGHRGATGHVPENTLDSVRKALELGAPCIEVDVHMVDGHLFVFHDNRLERTTNGTGYLHEQSYAYLRSLDAGGGQRIPTLEEVCDVIGERACLNIELKGAGTVGPVAAMVRRLLKQGWRRDAILVSSFNHRDLFELKGLEKEIRIGALVCGIPLGEAKFAQNLGAFSVHPFLDFVDTRFVQDAHKRGLRVYVYTVDHPEDIDRMHRLGVDGILTNFPERVLNRYSQGDSPPRWV